MKDMTSERMYRTTAKVGAGHRIELFAPNLAEGERVDVILLPSTDAVAPDASAFSIIDALDLPVRDASYWAERERELQESRDSWDR